MPTSDMNIALLYCILLYCIVFYVTFCATLRGRVNLSVKITRIKRVLYFRTRYS